MVPVRAAALLVLAGLAGCATYSDHTRVARDMLAQGNLPGSLQQFDGMLQVAGPEQLPDDFGSETALALAERGMVQQALGRYEQSARDLAAADRQLELLDLANDTAGDIGKYIYSDSATRYKASPTEKLALSSVNLVNYLARGDIEGAKVEARRYAVMSRYLADYFPNTPHSSFGAYLAGFAFEKGGAPGEAAHFYKEAEAGGPVPTAPADPAAAEVLVVVKTGRVPAREPARIPIGLALGIASNYFSGDTRVLEYGAFKVLTYPELVPAHSLYAGATVSVDGQVVGAPRVTDLSAEIRAEYEAAKPKMMAAGLTRMVTRAVAAEAARAAGNKQSGLLGFLAAAAAEGTLVALDKPDTRSWSTLAALVQIARFAVEPGKRRITVRLEGPYPELVERDVDLPAGGFSVIDVTTLR